ncbi:3'-5' exonuclease [Ktedonobacter racemifer]|uniref:Exonuclease RNase T and DNA polymerase III n=1 Tax=Ktedonobacter racemifer DSM 44963 TaxID=485913 RepID=D6U8Q1_KTERA|nr:3'-5' exonuclease [Ktedonobacter racemifer]EFH79611.1 Exonuclease RNase T and DNA polymerase III [Ktedonobacter racemifer DSM 44963]
MSEILATTRQRVLYKARQLWEQGFNTFDSETTGLDSEDQIIQWAVCNQEGQLLGSGYIKPTVPISEGAFEIHGITEAQLANAPLFAESWPTIRDLLTASGKTVVIYNSNFDIGMLWSSARAHGIPMRWDEIKAECAMQLFASFYGEYHEYWGSYTWQKLTTAISHLNITVPGEAHNAEHDAAATAHIIRQLAELADKELPAGWHPPVLVPCAGGCRQAVKECAEADEVWYCRSCGVEHGVYHRCPGCGGVVETPSRDTIPDDLCKYCHQALHQETMLLIGAWHRCPDPRCPHITYNIVQSPDLGERCPDCQRRYEWRRQVEEAERERQERIARERKEHRRAYAKAYRQRRKEREQENRRRAELGLPPLEDPKPAPADKIIKHLKHEFERVKYDDGSSGLHCRICDASWSRLPRCWCAGIKTYRSWIYIPKHLKTRTQLLKLRLKPAKNQKPAAVVDGAFDRYNLYDETAGK